MWLEGTDKLEECPRVLVKTYPPPVRLTWTDTAESESACQNLPSTCSPDLNWQSTVWECLSKLNLHLFAWLELTEQSLRLLVKIYPPPVRLTWIDRAQSESVCQNLPSTCSPDLNWLSRVWERLSKLTLRPFAWWLWGRPPCAGRRWRRSKAGCEPSTGPGYHRISQTSLSVL